MRKHLNSLNLVTITAFLVGEGVFAWFFVTPESNGVTAVLGAILLGTAGGILTRFLYWAVYYGPKNKESKFGVLPKARKQEFYILASIIMPLMGFLFAEPTRRDTGLLSWKEFLGGVIVATAILTIFYVAANIGYINTEEA